MKQRELVWRKRIRDEKYEEVKIAERDSETSTSFLFWAIHSLTSKIYLVRPDLMSSLFNEVSHLPFWLTMVGGRVAIFDWRNGRNDSRR